jgi:hypothetical protein
LAAALARETALANAVPMIEREAQRLTGATMAVCVFIGWVHRVAWTVHGHALSHEVIELVAKVAGSGHRAVSSHTIVEPIGRAPARAVLVVRRDDGFRAPDVVVLGTLAATVAPTIDRLVR